MPDMAQGPPALSSSDATLIKCLMDTLPDDWAVIIDAHPEMEWAAFIYHAEAPTSAPLFTICRWDNCVGLFVRWVDETATSIMFAELSSALDLIPRGIFASARTRQVTVLTEGWADTKH